jgi:hypothetical protein
MTSATIFMGHTITQRVLNSAHSLGDTPTQQRHQPDVLLPLAFIAKRECAKCYYCHSDENLGDQRSFDLLDNQPNSNWAIIAKRYLRHSCDAKART